MRVIPIIAILAILILETVAILQGINGVLIGIAIAAIAGLGGWEAKAIKDKVKGGKS